MKIVLQKDSVGEVRIFFFCVCLCVVETVHSPYMYVVWHCHRYVLCVPSGMRMKSKHIRCNQKDEEENSI